MADLNHFKDDNCSFTSECLMITEIVPRQYFVNLNVMPAERFILGIVDIIINIKKPMRCIIMNARGLKPDISHSYITTIDANISAENCTEYNFNPRNEDYKLIDIQNCDENEILIVTFNKHIVCGLYDLHIEYNSTKEKTNDVFYPYISKNYRE